MRKLIIAVLTLAFISSPAFLPATSSLASSAQAATSTMAKHKAPTHKTVKHKMTKKSHKAAKKPAKTTDTTKK